MNRNYNSVESVLSNMVEVELENQDDFLKLMETLTRIGIPNNQKKTLTQTCHVLHKKGRYYIAHFKELFGLDGKPVNINELDIARRNTIVDLLDRWGLLRIKNEDDFDNQEFVSVKDIKIIPHKEKGEWELVKKYTLGNKKD